MDASPSASPTFTEDHLGNHLDRLNHRIAELEGQVRGQETIIANLEARCERAEKGAGEARMEGLREREKGFGTRSEVNGNIARARALIGVVRLADELLANSEKMTSDFSGSLEYEGDVADELRYITRRIEDIQRRTDREREFKGKNGYTGPVRFHGGYGRRGVLAASPEPDDTAAAE